MTSRVSCIIDRSAGPTRIRGLAGGVSLGMDSESGGDATQMVRRVINVQIGIGAI